MVASEGERRRKKRRGKPREPGGHTALRPGEWISCEAQTAQGPISFRIGMSRLRHIIIHAPPSIKFVPPTDET